MKIRETLKNLLAGLWEVKIGLIFTLIVFVPGLILGAEVGLYCCLGVVVFLGLCVLVAIGKTARLK